MLGFEITFWNWWIIATGLFVVELIAPSTILLWPAIGAAVLGFVALVVPGMPAEWQIFLFAIISVVTAVFGVPFVKQRKLEGGPTGLNSRGEANIGRNARLEAKTSNGRGNAWIDGTRWTVKTQDGSDFSKEAHVKVVAADGATLTIDLDRD